MIHIDTNGYSMLEIFVCSENGKDGYVLLYQDRELLIKEPAGMKAYCLIKIPVDKASHYDLLLEGCSMSIAYLSGDADIYENGICFIESDGQLGKSQLKQFYDTPYREQYHFNPFKNWINDPNGLCWYQGRYHLFYQANPNGQSWDNMYWGHASSTDLVHWVHLPYVLTPQQELLYHTSRKGGAFSGSAVPLEKEVVFYLTRHEGPLEDCPETRQWQTMMRSSDLLEFTQEREIIRIKPKGVGYDFRDPKVVKIGDVWYMVLAANLEGESAILLYSSWDMQRWSYEGPLLTEPDRKAATMECPDFFFLDGTYVAVGALMKHVDEHGRIQMTRCYLGDFKDCRFKIDHTQWFDFGSNFYAVQSFEHQGRRIAIGWISDFYHEHVEVYNGAYGSMSIPRQLNVTDGRLYMKPAEEIYSLKEELLYQGREPELKKVIEGNTYYARITFLEETDFTFLLGKEDKKGIWLVRKDGVTAIRTEGCQSSDAWFPADTGKVKTIEIFGDRRVYEVFINDGEAAGTKLFYTSQITGIFQGFVDKKEALEQIELYSMSSIW